MNAVKTLKREFVKNSKDFVTFLKPTGVSTGRVKATAKKEFSVWCHIKGIFVIQKNEIGRNVGEIQGYSYKFHCLKENWDIEIDQTFRAVYGLHSDMLSIKLNDHWLISTIEFKKLLQYDYGIYVIGLEKVKTGKLIIDNGESEKR